MKKTSLYILLLSSLGLAACGNVYQPGNGGDGATTPPEPDKPAVEDKVAPTGTLYDINVQTEGCWTAVGSEAWCMPSVATGYGATTLQVNMMPNLTGKTRTAKVTVAPLAAAKANAPRRKAAAAAETVEYVFTQEPATVTTQACHITGVECLPTQVRVYLAVTGTASGIFLSVSGLSNKPSSGGNVLLPPAANLSIGTDGKDYAVIVGDNCSYGAWAYGVSGWEGREMELTLNTEPACKQKVYFDQSAMLHPINTDENAPTCGGSAQIRFAVGGRVYFGGGYSARGHQNSVMGNSQSWGDPCTDLTVYDPATDALSACKPLPEALVYGSAAVVNGKAYAASFDGALYEYNSAQDSWTNLGVNLGRCDAMYALGTNLCVVDNASGTVSHYSVSGSLVGQDTYSAGSTVVALSETSSRAWLAVDKAIYLHDAQGLRRVTTLVSNGLVTAYNGQLYYFVSAEGVVNAYNPTEKTHTRVPMSLFTAGGPGVDTFHSGLPLVAEDGVGYLFNCGYSRWGDLTWSGKQSKKAMRIDMRHSYKVVVKD